MGTYIITSTEIASGDPMEIWDPRSLKHTGISQCLHKGNNVYDLPDPPTLFVVGMVSSECKKSKPHLSPSYIFIESRKFKN